MSKPQIWYPKVGSKKMNSQWVRKSRHAKWIVNSIFELGRVVLGLTLLFTGVTKIRHPYVFLTTVYQYELLGPKAGEFTAMTLPWVELLTGLCLLSGVLLGGALLSATFLMAIFTFAQASVAYRHITVQCGCFSLGEPTMVSLPTITRTSLFLVLAATCLFCWVLELHAQNRLPSAVAAAHLAAPDTSTSGLI